MEPKASEVNAESYFAGQTLPWGYRLRSETFKNDLRPDKLDLAAGVLRDESGQIMSFESVQLARKRVLDKVPDTGYLQLQGLPSFRNAIQDLVLPNPPPNSTAFTLQTVGSTGALSLIAKTFTRLQLPATALVANNSWGNHTRIFAASGFDVQYYKYFNETSRAVETEDLIASFSNAPDKSVLILQTACHQTGYDIPISDWPAILDAAQAKGHLVVFDQAYLGYGRGVKEDLLPIELASKRGLDFVISTSCGKTFSRFDEPLGALTIVLHDKDLSDKLETQFNSTLQTEYSSPAYPMAAAVSELLTDANFRNTWISELNDAREMIAARRRSLVDELSRLGAGNDLLAIGKQVGPFAWTGLSKTASRALWTEFAINIPSNGRLCLSALPLRDCSRLASCLVDLLAQNEQ